MDWQVWSVCETWLDAVPTFYHLRWYRLFGYVLQDPVNLIDPEVLQSIDSFNVRLQSAIARGDVQQLETMLEALAPEQQIIARNVIERFGSKTADWMGKYCKGQI